MSYSVILNPKNGAMFTRYQTGTDLDASPTCENQIGSLSQSSTYFNFYSKVATEHFLGLVARAAQLASISPTGIGVSASPTAP
jgi:hypothetical protein